VPRDDKVHNTSCKWGNHHPYNSKETKETNNEAVKCP
jgi:hypothetical protein